MKPCPFCGSSVSFEPYKNNGLKIECKSCLVGYHQRTLRYGLEWLAEKMAETWNRRAPASEGEQK
nr:Lar family restriction alleviation protein [Burkholderia multivorans]